MKIYLTRNEQGFITGAFLHEGRMHEVRQGKDRFVDVVDLDAEAPKPPVPKHRLLTLNMMVCVELLITDGLRTGRSVVDYVTNAMRHRPDVVSVDEVSWAVKLGEEILEQFEK